MRYSAMQRRRQRQSSPTSAPVQFAEQAHREKTASRTPGNRTHVASSTWSFAQIPVTRAQNAVSASSEHAAAPVQRRVRQADRPIAPAPEPSISHENRTGLPGPLKTAVENLSGRSLDGTQVYYNSPKPARVNALAYTQGKEIHMGPGQEKHLPHEAWHRVQQMQGRVRPTMQMKGVGINDNQRLEREADVMGSKAVSVQSLARMQERSVEASGKLQSNTYSGMHNPSPLTQHTIQCFGRQVDPDDEPQLYQHIINYRANRNYHQQAFARGGHNVAVAYDNNNGIWLTDHSHNGLHGEVNVDGQVGAQRNQVTRIHTEREPCVPCEQFIRNNYITPGILTENQVTYWTGYQSKRKKGNKELKDIIGLGMIKRAFNKVKGSITRSGRVVK